MNFPSLLKNINKKLRINIFNGKTLKAISKNKARINTLFTYILPYLVSWGGNMGREWGREEKKMN